MTRAVTFIDTSVLVEILGVPGKSQQSSTVRSELASRVASGESMVLPTAAIIETGNHIAQLGDGRARRTLADRFATLLTATAIGEAPWVLHGARWDAALLTALCEGVRGAPGLVEMALQGVGVGDVSILAEASEYAARVAHVDVHIWTLEALLAAYA